MDAAWQCKAAEPSPFQQRARAADNDACAPIEPVARTRHCGGRGEPMVLLHPFALCSEVWKPVLPHLKAHHDVFAVGIPGHAGSEPLPADFQHSIEAACDVIERKLDALGLERAHLVGNSLGGWLAIELARRMRALSVVALAPGGGWKLGSREHRRLLRKFKATKALLSIGGPLAGVLGHLPLARKMFFSDVVARPERLSPADARLFIESAWRCATYGNVLKALPTQPLSEPLSPLPCPVRLVWGEKDRLLPLQGYSEHWRHVLPGAEWVMLEDVGHVQMYDDPDAVAHSILELTARGGAVEVLSTQGQAQREDGEEPERLAG